MKITKKAYTFEYLEQENAVNLYNPDGVRYMMLPAWVLFTLSEGEAVFTDFCHTFSDDTLTVTAKSTSPIPLTASFSFTLLDEEIEVHFTAEGDRDFAAVETEFFRNGHRGLYMVDCIRYFAPAPRNYEGINRAFGKCFPDCSMDGYFSPPPLNFCIGNGAGWLGFGLLDLPNSYEYRLSGRLGVLVEAAGGKLTTPAGTAYRAPGLLLTFPRDEWESITVFSEALQKRGLLPEVRQEVPAWWHRPQVVTYGDEMLDLQYNWYVDEDLDSPRFNTEYLENWLAAAEEKLGNTEFTIMVDAYWQKRWCAEARADETRFQDLRAFIDRAHARGHRVVLWTAPMVDTAYRGEDSLTKKYGLLSEDTAISWLTKGRYIVDYTGDIDGFVEEQARLFFSSDPDALNCDGLKLDFLASIRNPRNDVHYNCAENGIGVREMYRFYDKFSRAAKAVKPDVMLNGSACDPRFAHFIAQNRLHDIQNVYGEREVRARVSTLACPDLIVDSDGAIMLSDWVEETYINAVVYGTPSLYYVKKFHDGVSLSDEKMRSLGSLLSLSGKKTGGRVRFVDAGHWQLWKDGRVTAETFGGRSLFVYDGNGTMYLFSWEDTIEMDVHDYTFENLPEGFSQKAGKLCGKVQSGKVYTLSVHE